MKLGFGSDHTGAQRPISRIGIALDLPQVHDVDEEISQRWIERAARPVHAADFAREVDAYMSVAYRQKRSAQFNMIVRHQLTAGSLQLRSDRGDVVHRHRLPCQRWRLNRERLRRRGLFERHVALGHRTLDDSVNRFAVGAIQQIEQRVLRDHRNRRNYFAIVLQIHQQWRSLGVKIPDVVVNQLEVPECICPSAHPLAATMLDP